MADNDDHHLLFTQNEIKQINNEIAELELLISQNKREDTPYARAYSIDLYCCVISCMPHYCLPTI